MLSTDVASMFFTCKSLSSDSSGLRQAETEDRVAQEEDGELFLCLQQKDILQIAHIENHLSYQRQISG